MYRYEWDPETGGYNLSTKVTGLDKETRPVFPEELDFLGLAPDFGWTYPHCDAPLLWAEGRRYVYRGKVVAEAQGGGLYAMPTMKNVERGLTLDPVDLRAMYAKNESLLNGLIQKTLRDIYSVYESYRDKVDIMYAAFSGGKDSALMLDLLQRAIPHDAFSVIFGDTTMELSDTYENVRKAEKFWPDLDWHRAQADLNATESWKLFGPPSRTIRWCCGVHKSAPSVLKIKEILAKKRARRVEDIKNFKALAFIGVRAEESETRSTYGMIADGNKHAVQINCNPILEWATAELFLYTFAYGLPFNDMYRKGAHRVGCLLCPMAAKWYECVVNHVYEPEVSPFIETIKSSMRKDYADEAGWKQYLQEGGWKQRSSGKLLRASENKIIPVSTEEEEKLFIKNANYTWKKWMITFGDFAEIEEGLYSVQHGNLSILFREHLDGDLTTISFKPLVKSKDSIRFMYLFKNVFYKSAYCGNCKECMAECPYGALTITSDNIIIRDCRHCGQCLDKPKGCSIAKSMVATGDGNMNAKNIDRYKNFGLRRNWVSIFLESPGNFWQNQRMGTQMFRSFEKWGKEAGLIDQFNAPVSHIQKLVELGADSAVLWGYVYANIAYNSAIVNWYIRTAQFGEEYKVSDLQIILGDYYSETTKKNALSSLKDTLKSSPIGQTLGQGICEMKGKQVVSLTRTVWADPEPVVILYALYLFAEKSDRLFSFTLRELLSDSEERVALSPRILFGLESDVLKPILQGLANDYGDFIRVDFNKGIMDNIFLDSEKSSGDVVALM